MTRLWAIPLLALALILTGVTQIGAAELREERSEHIMPWGWFVAGCGLITLTALAALALTCAAVCVALNTP